MSEFRAPSPGDGRPHDDLVTDRMVTGEAAGLPGLPGVPTAQPAQRVRPAGIGGALRRLLRLATLMVAAYCAVVVALVAAYRIVDPPASSLMLIQQMAGVAIDRRPVPLARISPALVRAVVASEDARFCSHHGVDWGELRAAIEKAQDGIARGGSTISMQVAKNLFLWPSKSYLRKALEIPITFLIEFAWSKSRILEIYLNIAEWGPGIFGAEAAARYHFGKSASRLNEREAALLAASLPNPIARDAGDPGAGTQRLATHIESRMRAAGARVRCVLP